MYSKRSFVAVALCAVALPLAACGGSDSKDPPTGTDSGTNPPAQGTHYQYVVSKAYIPASMSQARDYGLDLGAAKSGTPDGTIDNVLGEAFVTLSGYGFDLQTTITTAINQGKITLLLDYQTTDFTTAATAGLAVKLGGTSTPPACTDANDTTCGHQLDGNASFTVAANSPTNDPISGAVASGTFNGGPGNLSLQVAVGSTDPVLLNLHNARVKLTGASATGGSAIIGGALTVADLNANVIPAIQKTLEGVLLADCGPVADRSLDPTKVCSCMATTSAGTILGLFDGDITGSVKDCQISTDEIIQSPFIKAVLSADICSTASCATPDALSFGIKVDAVKATITN